MAADLPAIVARLESVTSRLEGLASGGGAGQGTAEVGSKCV